MVVVKFRIFVWFWVEMQCICDFLELMLFDMLDQCYCYFCLDSCDYELLYGIVEVIVWDVLNGYWDWCDILCVVYCSCYYDQYWIGVQCCSYCGYVVGELDVLVKVWCRCCVVGFIWLVQIVCYL